jgi:hypothetical protein
VIAREEIPQRDGLLLQLLAIRGNDRTGLFEIRRKTRGGMAQEFVPLTDVERVMDIVVAQGERADVYIGAAPRLEAKGGRDAIRHVWSLWADCDSSESVQALERFDPAPQLVVESGTPGNLHAWWPLLRPLEPQEAERANRRLAHHLGADLKATDGARIMRPAGTLNHKHEPPRPVAVVAFMPVRRTPTAREIVGHLEAAGVTLEDRFDVEDVRLDIQGLRNEQASVRGTQPRPLDAREEPAAAQAGPSADDIARGVMEQLAQFQAGRADLFRGFGSNTIRRGAFGGAFMDTGQQAAGLRHFGAFAQADAPGMGGGFGQRPVHFEVHHHAPPPDPHAWTRTMLYAAQTEM